MQADEPSPLYIASQHGHDEVVRTLLAAGADVNALSGSAVRAKPPPPPIYQATVASVVHGRSGLYTMRGYRGEWVDVGHKTCVAQCVDFACASLV